MLRDLGESLSQMTPMFLRCVDVTSCGNANHKRLATRVPCSENMLPG
jgi:hypothetical protein